MMRLSMRIIVLFGTGTVLTIATLLKLGASLEAALGAAMSMCAMGVATFLLSRPADKLIDASLRFNDGIDEVPDHIHVGKKSAFAPLAKTMGLFGDMVHNQSKTFWTERLEKEAVLASLDEGVVICDSEGKITQMNETASGMLEVKDVVGRRLIDVRREYGELLEATLLNRSAVTDTIHSFDVTVTPRAKREGAILVFRDGSNDQKIEQMGRDFVANASHELRTPITIIKGFAETLRDLPEISEAMLEDITDKIIRNCERMGSLVKSLITLADLDAMSKTEFQKCDLIVLADRCKQTLLTIHSDIECEIISTDEEVAVHCDPNLIELALMNLLENGVKYSEAPAKLTVRVEEEDEAVTLHVSDKGKGIPEKDIEHIFDRFYTVDKAHSRKLGGAGLGLSIVKRIVAIHNAHISVTSNEGTTFTLSFPKQVS